MISSVCKKCDKRIEAYTEKQLKYLMAQHVLAKHTEDSI